MFVEFAVSTNLHIGDGFRAGETGPAGSGQVKEELPQVADGGWQLASVLLLEVLIFVSSGGASELSMVVSE